MIAAVVRLLVALIACVVVIAQSESIVDLVAALADAASQNPAGALAAAACIIVFFEVARFMARLIRPAYVAREASMGAMPLGAARGALEEREIAEFDLPRRAKHEAAHAVVALELGCTDVCADIIKRGRSEGRTRYQFVTDSIENAAFADMIIALAGHIVDVSDGHFDQGSVSDMRALIECAVMILSTGRRPALHDDDLTIDGLVRSARSIASRLLDEQGGTVIRVAESLTEARSLDDAQLRKLSAVA